MRWAPICLTFLALQLFPKAVIGMSQSDIDLSSRTIPQGSLSLIKITVGDGEVPQVTWMQKEIGLFPTERKNVWYGFLGVDLTAKPGVYKAKVRVLPSDHNRHLEVTVSPKDYGLRRLTLPKHMVDLDSKTLARVRRESRIMRELWEAPPSRPLWHGPFLRPIPGEVVGPFGRRSIINDQPRAPHSGVDLRGARGTPIRATNDGLVVLTGDHFFTGRSVVIDHGGGIQSMYFHLEKVMVEQGDMVKKGHAIGLVGSSGRATGPHLHWGMRINGARIDPMQLTEKSRSLEK